MSDRKQAGPAAGRPPKPPIDPRILASQQFVAKVVDKAKREKEADKNAAQRWPGNGTAVGKRTPAAFTFEIAPATFAHLVLAALALTFVGLAAVWSYAVLNANFTAGRVMALSLGMICAAVLGYLSVLFLSVVESTSNGRTSVESLQGEWREWFWTLPSTLGLLAIAVFIGWLLSVVLTANFWFMIAACAVLLYPILQLSSLETGSPFAPLSLPVLASTVKHPLGWFVFYAISCALANSLWLAARLAWHDPPYITVFIVAPIATVALFFYAWLLGQLAHLISKEKDA
jgi:hypothetical protein